MKRAPVGLPGQLVQVGLGLEVGAGVGNGGFDALVVGHGSLELMNYKFRPLGKGWKPDSCEQFRRRQTDLGIQAVNQAVVLRG